MLDFSLFARKARPLIGLDISTSSVKMVELSGDDKLGYCIERYAVEPLVREAVVDGNVSNLEAVSDSVRRASVAWRATPSWLPWACRPLRSLPSGSCFPAACASRKWKCRWRPRPTSTFLRARRGQPRFPGHRSGRRQRRRRGADCRVAQGEGRRPGGRCGSGRPQGSGRRCRILCFAGGLRTRCEEHQGRHRGQDHRAGRHRRDFAGRHGAA